jgi:spermidine synthase
LYAKNAFGVTGSFDFPTPFSQTGTMPIQSFYPEMIVHPALFSHAKPQVIAILGNAPEIVAEVLKHPSVNQVTCIGTHQQQNNDPRVTYPIAEPLAWLAHCQTAQFDIIIQTEAIENQLSHYHRPLKENGILVQPLQTYLFQLDSLTPLYQSVQQAGYQDCQLLNFPQPDHPYGWHTIMLLTKQPDLKRIREKDIYNRSFATRYYNYDTHRAALALPEFLREEVEL